jgi:hypothetical protein
MCSLGLTSLQTIPPSAFCQLIGKGNLSARGRTRKVPDRLLWDVSALGFDLPRFLSHCAIRQMAQRQRLVALC